MSEFNIDERAASCQFNVCVAIHALASSEAVASATGVS